MNMKRRRLKTILIFVMVLLLVPLVAMQFTDEVNWGPLDFVVAGVLLLSTGFIFVFYKDTPIWTHTIS